MMPEIAARLSAPLAQAGSIVFVQADQTGGLGLPVKYIMSVQEVVKTITGIDLIGAVDESNESNDSNNA